MFRLRESLTGTGVKLNLEMAATEEMVRIAREAKAKIAMLVPEGRQEVTTEGGLDIVGNRDHLADIVAELRDAGLIVSAFIDADPGQIEAAASTGFDVCEVHSGPYAHAFADVGGDFLHERLKRELRAVTDAGERIRSAGMRFNAGHALNYHNVQPIAALEGIAELHIGHAIVSRAIFDGLREAVAVMKRLMVEAAVVSRR